jgi:serine/threonine-protein kinase
MSGAAISKLGRYRILAELGRGAMGVVYLAEDPLLNRTVAIKTILMSGEEHERAEYEARFFQEARAAGGLNHPGIITIHDIGREGDVAYMAMEALDGIELREMMRRGRVPLALALELAAQVADGLAFAHERGVVHRDVKPANVMVIRGHQAKIMDFGIARLQVSEVKTQTGAVLGSPKYMSPEQVTGRRADHRSDIFSLGLILYELACGASPFSADSITGLMHAIAAESAPPPSTVNPSLPPVFDLIVARALEKDPAARYQGAVELAADLRACLAALPSEAPAAPAPVDAEKTVKLAPTGAAQTASRKAETTLINPDTQAFSGTTASAPGESSRSLPPGTAPLYVSRAFDSSSALQALAAMAASGVTDAGAHPPHGVGDTLRAIWSDPDQRWVAMAALVAMAGAVAIVLI